ncbi:MAG: dienelactone hydrolase family protein [Acidiferrobacter sp.]
MKNALLSYDHNGTLLEGYLAWDESRTGRRPGVLVVHEWMGISDHERHSCDRLAKAGYLALAVDIFGKDHRPQTMEQAAANANEYRAGDRALLRARVRAGFDALRAQALCDPTRIAALGFCFGGTTALELARSGADLRGVISFHGSLATATPARAGVLKAKVLALHGAEDPFVPETEVVAFEQEMRAAQADWQLCKYSGAVHSFTNEGAGDEPSRGFAYNRSATTRSWQAMLNFLAEIFA